VQADRFVGSVCTTIRQPRGAGYRTPTHDYAATREAAMIAFAKSWRRE